MSNVKVSEDQNLVEFNSRSYHFIPSKDLSNSACEVCDLHYSASACDVAPCLRQERTDGQNGIFILK